MKSGSRQTGRGSARSVPGTSQPNDLLNSLSNPANVIGPVVTDASNGVRGASYELDRIIQDVADVPEEVIMPLEQASSTLGDLERDFNLVMDELSNNRLNTARRMLAGSSDSIEETRALLDDARRSSNRILTTPREVFQGIDYARSRLNEVEANRRQALGSLP